MLCSFSWTRQLETSGGLWSNRRRMEDGGRGSQVWRNEARLEKYIECLHWWTVGVCDPLCPVWTNEGRPSWPYVNSPHQGDTPRVTCGNPAEPYVTASSTSAGQSCPQLELDTLEQVDVWYSSFEKKERTNSSRAFQPLKVFILSAMCIFLKASPFCQNKEHEGF